LHAAARPATRVESAEETEKAASEAGPTIGSASPDERGKAEFSRASTHQPAATDPSSTVSTVSLAAFALLAVSDWVAVARGWKGLEYFAKPATLAALLVYAANGHAASAWLLAALGLSLLGDVFLMLPADLFLAGLTAFLLAHVAYIIDFKVSVTARAVCLAITLTASSPLAIRIMRAIDDAGLRSAVALYMGVIALMVASAFASGSAFAAAGATLFFISDALIAWDRFVSPRAWTRTAIIITYHLGQLGLVIALR
jgi:uncharacterized membrane protein YhhN